ncbi:MAG: sulfite exporter TauE/SafE family protein [Spirochaetales bacterium]|nr:sulfite exporter TauE/SafE family protein [Spirochaetales bacterium]
MQFLYLIISFTATCIGAISGIGGGVIIKPVMDSLSSFNVSVISFLSGLTVLGMTISSLIINRNSEIKLEKKTSTLLAFGSVLGGMGGKLVFEIIKNNFGEEAIIGVIQSSVLSFLMIAVFLFTIFKNKLPSASLKNGFLCFITGLILGSLASFLGIGGGPINLAILFLLFSMDSKTAARNSIFIIFFSQMTNFLFTLFSGNIPQFDPLVLILMITGGILGGIIGSRISKKISNRQIDFLFSIVMIFIIVVCIYNIFGYCREI